MTILHGEFNIPSWGKKTTPSDENQFFKLFEVESGTEKVTFKRIYYTTLAVYYYRKQNTSDTTKGSNNLLNDFSNIIPAFLSGPNTTVGWVVELGAALFNKNDANKILSVRRTGSSFDAQATLLGTIYSKTPFTTESLTLGGLKDGTSITDPVTDYSGASSHTTQPEAVQRVTFNGGVTKSFIFLANKFGLTGTSGLSGNLFMWNYTLSSWVSVSSATPGFFDNGGGGLSRDVYGSGFFKSSDFVSSNIAYIKYQCTGSGPGLTSIQNPIFYQGEPNPQEKP